MNIEGIEIGAAQPCRFVAEISNNHNGSLTRALWLIDVAAEAGAEFVKFQAYTPDELVALRGDGPAPEPWGSQGYSMRQLYEMAQTPLDWFPKLFTYARSRGIVPFSSVFGAESLACLETVDCPAYKIARLDSEVASLRAMVMGTDKPVLISTDGALSAGQFHDDVALLYCPPGYPTPAAAVQLPTSFVGNLDYDMVPEYLGLSSHCLAPELPIAAVARGCKLIEMHLQHSEMPSRLEREVSLTEHELAAMIRAVRATEEMLG